MLQQKKQQAQRQAVMEERRRQQRERALQAQQKERARKVHLRIRMISYNIAARKIQRWWRAKNAARKEAAAIIIAEALRRNTAVKQARNISDSIKKLIALEREIIEFPSINDAEVIGTDKQSIRARLVFEHTLEKLVLSADDIPTHGSATARAIRKRLVVKANARLTALDEAVKQAATATAATAANLQAMAEEMNSDEAPVEMDTDDGSSSVVLSAMEQDETDSDSSSEEEEEEEEEEEQTDDDYEDEDDENTAQDEDGDCVLDSENNSHSPVSLSADQSAACLEQVCNRYETELVELKEQIGSLPDDMQVASILKTLLSSLKNARSQLADRVEA
jgi:hypothetical protein